MGASFHFAAGDDRFGDSGRPDVARARIVVVDDEPANVALLQRMLSSAGFGDVIGITDARQAVPRCLDAEADLLLLDLHMPEVDGLAVMSALSEALPDDRLLPIIVLTADVTLETRRAALAAGALDFLTKPLDHIEVLLRVRNLLRTKQLHDRLRDERASLERRVAERTVELEEANRALRALDEMKRDFIAMVSHEMRTPLTVIGGFTDVMIRNWDRLDDARRREQADAIKRNTSRLELLVDNLLRAAALETGKTTAVGRHERPSVAIREVISHAVNDSGLDADDVIIDCADRLELHADPEMLQSIVLNLLTNACKYGGAPVHITATSDDDSLDMSIRDHGPGVPPEFADQLFDRFSQASVGDRRTASGAGLGLWIARALAEAHGGSIHYEPARPGAIFRLRLPHHRRDADRH